MATTTKDPRRVAAGRAGMRARYGPERVGIRRITDLEPELQDIARALIRADEIAKARAAEEADAADAAAEAKK